MSSELEQPENDIIRPTAPSTGAEEMVLGSNQAQYNEIVVAKYVSLELDDNGVVIPDRQIPTLLYRFKPSEQQRRQIMAGEDLFLSVMTFGRPPLPLALQVGPGGFQIARAIVSPHDDKPIDPSHPRIIIP
jgi:hypothetical protein